MTNWINSSDYLLDTSILVDAPLPVFKSFSQILEENLLLIGIFLLILLLGATAFYWLKRKKQVVRTEENIVQIDPYREAKKELKALAQKKDRSEPKPYIFTLSRILRLYIERQFKLSALEQTSEEFINSVSNHSFLAQHCLQSIEEFAKAGDLIKYAPQSSMAEEMSRLFKLAEGTIDLAHQELEKKKRKETQANKEVQTT